jgi:23S rRNA (uracil1939-C5)-methyltransferase
VSRPWCCATWSLCDADKDQLRAFAAQHGVQWWLQPKGPDTVHLLDGASSWPMACRTSASACRSGPRTSPRSIRTSTACWWRALRLLDAQKHERVIDWFCGLGNFTLPIATQAREVLGVEGSEALVARSRQKLNQAQGRRSKRWQLLILARNLFEMTPETLIADGVADKWLVDPPREGAFALSKALADIHQARLGAEARPRCPPACGLAAARRIVYVSCNPATGARRRPAGAPGGLPLHGGGRGQHVPAHGPCGEHGGVRGGPFDAFDGGRLFAEGGMLSTCRCSGIFS